MTKHHFVSPVSLLVLCTPLENSRGSQYHTRSLETTSLHISVTPVFAVVQGYSFKVLTDLLEDDRGQGALQLQDRDSRLALLAKLKSSEAAVGIEKDANDDGLPGKASVRRRKRAIADITGADATYREGAAKKRKPGSGGNLRKLVNRRRAA